MMFLPFRQAAHGWPFVLFLLGACAADPVVTPEPVADPQPSIIQERAAPAPALRTEAAPMPPPATPPRPASSSKPARAVPPAPATPPVAPLAKPVSPAPSTPSAPSAPSVSSAPAAPIATSTPLARPVVVATAPAWMRACGQHIQAAGAIQCDADSLLALPSAKVRVYTREPSLTRVGADGYAIQLREGLPQRYRYFVLP